MKELIQQIGSYNLFNYLLPGTIYYAVIQEITSYSFASDNIFVLAFLCYFVGMVISRIGSICIEPCLKSFKIIKFKDYKDFVEASKKDKKLEVLSEQNNTYRTLVALFLAIGITKGFNILEIEFEYFSQLRIWIVLGLMFFLFLAAYRKQTSYTSQRIEKNLQD